MGGTQMDYSIEFGSLLSRTRINLGKTQRSIMIKFGLNGHAVSHWERGNILPAEERIPDIAEAYGINQAVLLDALLLAKKEKAKYKDCMRSLRSKNPRKKRSDHEIQSIRETSLIYSRFNPVWSKRPSGRI